MPKGKDQKYVMVEYQGNPDDRMDEAMLSGVKKAKANLKRKKEMMISKKKAQRILDGLTIQEHASHDQKDHGNWAKGRGKKKSSKGKKEPIFKRDPKLPPIPKTWEEDSGKVAAFLKHDRELSTKQLDAAARKMIEVKVDEIINNDGKGVTADAYERAVDLVDSNPNFPEGFTFDDIYNFMVGDLEISWEEFDDEFLRE